MPERASVTQSVQIGVEVTPGTAVNSDKLLQSLAIELGQAADFNRFRPGGQKYASQIVPGREWTEFTLAGVSSFSELVYPLSSVAVSTTPTTVGTTGRQWIFTPAARTEDTVKTFTIEQGGAVRAQEASYGLFTSLELTFNRGEVTVGGSGIAQRLTDGITMTASPTAIQEKPILPNMVDVYLDSTSGALGTTKLTRAFEVVFNIGDRFNPVWPLNTALTSFGSHVETEPSVGGSLFLEADAQGMAYLTNLRAGDTRYLRIGCISSELAGTGQNYQLLIDAAVKFNDAIAFEDADGVYAARLPFEVIYDSAWSGGRAYQVTLVNQVSAL
jgi:hypothetical protein